VGNAEHSAQTGQRPVYHGSAHASSLALLHKGPSSIGCDLGYAWPGRPKRVFDISVAIELRQQGKTVQEIAQHVGVSYSTAYNALRQVGITKPHPPVKRLVREPQIAAN